MEVRQIYHSDEVCPRIFHRRDLPRHCISMNDHGGGAKNAFAKSRKRVIVG
jgi:hypothetical protein